MPVRERGMQGHGLIQWMAPALTLVFVELGTFAGSAFAQETPATHGSIKQRSPADQPLPIIGCGKARAALRRLPAERPPPPDARYLEAMADTDILHYDLDIEISNINPAQNTCLITGSNVMTIRSKSAMLSEFSFRLRSQYAITGAYVNGSTPVNVTTASSTTRVVTLDQTYGLDDVFTLTIEYTGNTWSGGLDSIMVSTHSGGVPVVATLSEPYYAYTWWPVKDGDVWVPGDNSDKATLDQMIAA